MPGFSVKPLGGTTWADFAWLVERHNGVWGGCWCMAFHPEGVGRTRTVGQNRSEKEGRVRGGRAHAALVYDGATCVGWCQFGGPDELPRIKRRRAYDEGGVALPDWRITCFFVGQDASRPGVAAAALKGALRGNRASRRRNGGKLSRGRGRPAGRGIVPAQRNGLHVRAPGVRANPPHREEPLGRRQGRARISETQDIASVTVCH